jgi:riboflavin synthase
MFTGVVAEVGRVRSVTRRGGVAHFTVAAPRIAPELEPGVSVAVNGACQTVTDVRGDTFGFDAVGETLRKTNLGDLAAGRPVNLEPALRLQDRISGHLVSGHVDATGVVRAKRSAGHANYDFAIAVPGELMAYICEKGSIALDGVSLTVKTERGSVVEVTVVPYTLENTTIKHWRVGTAVNIEVDQLAKYVSPKSGAK